MFGASSELASVMEFGFNFLNVSPGTKLSTLKLFDISGPVYAH